MLTQAGQGDVVLERLDDQLEWFSRRAAQNRIKYEGLKVVQIVVAASIPVFAVAGSSRVLLAVLGAVIVVVESGQQLFQFQQHWTNYRTTAEALKHEKYLFQAGAGAYAAPEQARAHLAETVEALVSQDTAAWRLTQSPQATTKV